jgi:WD40 repeat protein
MDVTTGSTLFTLSDIALDVDWSPDGKWLATSDIDRRVRIWDGDTGKLRFGLKGHNGPVEHADWSPDSSRLVSGSDDKTVKVWEISASGGKQLLSLSGRGTRNGALGVAFAPDGTKVMAGDQNIEAVTIWDASLDGDAEWAHLPSTPENLNTAAFTPDGRRVVTGLRNAVIVWDAETGAELRRLVPPYQPSDPDANVAQVRVAADGALAATATGQQVTVWNLARGTRRFTVALGDGVRSLDWSPVGELLAVASNTGSVTILDRSGQTRAYLQDGFAFTIVAVGFSPDGRYVAAARDPIDVSGKSPLRRVTIWDWKGRSVVRRIVTDTLTLSFDATGRRLVTGDPLRPAVIWDVRTGRKLQTLAGAAGNVYSVAFSHHGSLVATGGPDGTVRLWDATSGQRQLQLTGHTGVVSSVAFSSDDRKLVTAASDGSVRVWALDIDDLLTVANRKLTRDLRPDECRQYLHRSSCPRA